MELQELLDFIKKNKDLLDDLKSSTSDLISDAKAILVENSANRAKQFADAIKDKFRIRDGEQRRKALDDAILDVEKQLLETEDILEEMALNIRLSELLQLRANATVAGAFEGIIAFPDEEVERIQRLLKQVDEDIEARRDLKTAMGIVTRAISVTAQIAGRVATGGII